jgi:hypothetical protein
MTETPLTLATDAVADNALMSDRTSLEPEALEEPKGRHAGRGVGRA